jgi:hypothetical protein
MRPPLQNIRKLNTSVIEMLGETKQKTRWQCAYPELSSLPNSLRAGKSAGNIMASLAPIKRQFPSEVPLRI